MPKTSSSRSTYSRRSASSSRSGSRKSSKNVSVSNLTTDQKIDFIGIMLLVIGLLFLVAFFARNNGSLTGWMAKTMAQIGGRAGFVIPVGMTLGGLYLIFRKVERLPYLSAGRATGLVLFYLNLLTWLHFIEGGGLASAQQGLGGGYIGATLNTILRGSLGDAGEVVVLVVWLIVAVLFVMDIPLPDLVRRIADWKPRQKLAEQKSIPFPREHTRIFTPSMVSRADVSDKPVVLPEGFQSLDLKGEPLKTAEPQPRREEPARPVSVKPAGAPSAAVSEPKGTIPVVHTGVTAAMREKPWPLPSVADVLDPAMPGGIQSHYDKDRARIIEETLASFGAPGHIVEIHRGPAVTQFGVEPDFIENRSSRTRVRVSKIVSLSDDLALSLAAPSIRIQAPVPGKGYVGIEVPNTQLTLVSLRELLESEAFKRIKGPLRFALGKDVAGKPICADLTSMPHLLVAGTTNSGKSVLVNAILTSLLLNNTPSDMRLLLVDPKRV